MTLVTATALALGIAGQSARTARARRKLIVLGASMRSIGGVVALETASIIGIASMTTVPLTSLSLWSMRRLEASTVVRPATLLWVGAMMVGVTLAASASAAVIATRASDSRHE
jgi:hypothetical protein